ncbi:hypothetical protein ACTHAM_002869 [Cellulomonas soli]|uniref:hypothetical protein n=1 Tax=Cellulomonas soli TaxID=931535 RepID=UPI003F82B2C6
MSSLVLDRTRPVPAPAPVVFRPSSAVAVALAAARADVVRLEFSAAWPDIAALRGAVSLLHEELAAVGRPRAQVRVELAVEVIVVADPRVAAATRTRFEMLDALSGVAPHVGRGSLVGTADQVRAQAQRLARQVGADAVVTVPLAGT